MTTHANLTGADLHSPFPYNQDADPGRVGADKFWWSPANQAIKYRNAANSGWNAAIASSVNYSGAPGITVFPSNVTAAGMQTAFDGAAAGQIFMLPAATITMDQVIWLWKPVKLLGHPSGVSKLFVPGNPSDPWSQGTSDLIRIGNPNSAGGGCDGVYLGYFEIEHDRVASPDMRTLSIDIYYTASNVEVDHIVFTDVTSDCLIVRPNPDTDPNEGVHTLSFHDCTANEFWEGFFNFHQGSLYNASIYNNVAITTNEHAGYQGPMGVELNWEQGAGECVGVQAYNNSFTMTGAGVSPNGLVIKTSLDLVIGNTRYGKINIHHNTFDGFAWGAYITGVSGTFGTVPTDKRIVTIAENSFLNHSVAVNIIASASEPSYRSGSQYDRIVFARNNLGGGSIGIDQTELTGGAMNINQIGNF